MQEAYLNELLLALLAQLDIPIELKKSAILKYKNLGEWLKKDSEQRYQANSYLYPQGSIKIGTIIKPVNPNEDYDIDLVYKRDIKKESISQKELKKQVGEQLKDYIQHLKDTKSDEIPILKEGKRCWTLDYPDRFHMDILPALPDHEQQSTILPEEGIAITDKETKFWQLSNPKGYAKWFRSKNYTALNRRLEELAKSSNVTVEQIDEDEAKTTLQQSIQIIKRLRDIAFSNNEHNKPISVIISTLAAKAYNDDEDLLGALKHIVFAMEGNIVKKDGVYWIANPAIDNENFAEKWEGTPSLQTAFFEFISSLKHLFTHIQSLPSDQLKDSLSKSLGSEIVKDAEQRIKQKAQRAAAFYAGKAGSTSKTKPWSK